MLEFYGEMYDNYLYLGLLWMSTSYFLLRFRLSLSTEELGNNAMSSLLDY